MPVAGRTRWPLILVWAALAWGLADLAWHWRALPEVVASHFDARGRPDARMAKGWYALFHVGVLALMAGLFVWLPRWLRRAPDTLTQLPHKEHWLAPDRRAATLDFLVVQLRLIGVATILLLDFTGHQVIRDNLGRPAWLGPEFLWLLGAYMAFVGSICLRLVLRFRRRPATGAEAD